MIILGIDPGNIQSAFVRFDFTNNCVLDHFIIENEKIHTLDIVKSYYDFIALEKVASYGMPVGESVFETCVWSGRFMEIFNYSKIHRITRNKVKNTICHSSRAKDSNIRQALIDKFGVPGTKKSPGILYGFKKDEWAALAVAVTLYNYLT